MSERRKQPGRWHSSLPATVILPPGCLLRELRSFLLADGYVQCDDVLRLPRRDAVEVWQTGTLVGVFAYNDEQELDFLPPYANRCTRVTLQYLLPWLPIEHATSFVSAVERLSHHFRSPMLHAGHPISGADLEAMIQRLSDDLTERVDGPGSEFLAIAIAEDLPL